MYLYVYLYNIIYKYIFYVDGIYSFTRRTRSRWAKSMSREKKETLTHR